MINFETVEDFLFYATPITTKNTEHGKARAIVSQLVSSIQWLDREAKKEKNPQNKADLLKEITAAEREINTLKALIVKAEYVL